MVNNKDINEFEKLSSNIIKEKENTKETFEEIKELYKTINNVIKKSVHNLSNADLYYFLVNETEELKTNFKHKEDQKNIVKKLIETYKYIFKLNEKIITEIEEIQPLQEKDKEYLKEFFKFIKQNFNIGEQNE